MSLRFNTEALPKPAQFAQKKDYKPTRLEVLTTIHGIAFGGNSPTRIDTPEESKAFFEYYEGIRGIKFDETTEKVINKAYAEAMSCADDSEFKEWFNQKIGDFYNTVKSWFDSNEE